MVKVIVNKDIRESGPFLIDSTGLEELDNLLDTGWEKIRKIKNEIVEQRIEQEKIKYSSISLEKLENSIRKTYPIASDKISCIIEFKSGKIIEAISFKEIMSQPELKDETPISAKIERNCGLARVDIRVGPDELVVTLESDDINLNDLHYELKKWVDKFKPNPFLIIWKTVKQYHWPLFVLFALVCLLLYTPSYKVYKSILEKQAVEILKNGVDSTNYHKALHLLLAYETGYCPENIKPQMVGDIRYGKIFVIGLLLCIVLSFMPKNIIGIGKGSQKIKIWKWWIKFIYISVPVAIGLPIIIEKIQNYIK
jgi:hypothetical protein